MSKAKESKKRAHDSIREAMRHRIIYAFTLSGLQQTEIVKALGIDRSRVSRWFNSDAEQGETPGPDYLPLLPDLLGVDGHWLLTGDGPMRRTDPAASRVALDRIERVLREAKDRKG